jgi:hypothetical protein
MNEVLFSVLQSALIVVVLIATRYVIPYLKYKLLETVDDAVLNEIIKAVKSVEQDIRFTLGTEKKEEVMIRITGWANAHGIRITQGQLSQLIETAVWIMKNEDKLT